MFWSSWHGPRAERPHTGPPGKATNMGRPRKNGCMFIQKRVGFPLNKEEIFNDSMILMVCFRDLYIFFQQKTPPERFVSLSSFISIKIFQIHPELGSQQSNFQHLSALQCWRKAWMAFWVSWTVTYCYTNWLLGLLDYHIFCQNYYQCSVDSIIDEVAPFQVTKQPSLIPYSYGISGVWQSWGRDLFRCCWMPSQFGDEIMR